MYKNVYKACVLVVKHENNLIHPQGIVRQTEREILTMAPQYRTPPLTDLPTQLQATLGKHRLPQQDQILSL